MKEGYIGKTNLTSFIGTLARRFQIYAPCEEGNTVFFRRVADGKDISLSRPAHAAPKGAVFPQSETLFSFSFTKDAETRQKTDVGLKVEEDSPETVIVGCRPCDARGLMMLDKVFMEVDPYYAKRRERTIVVSLACPETYEGCFCTSVGGDPAGKAGSDVLMTEVDNGYFIEVLTDRGAAALEGVALEDGSRYKDEAGKRQQAVRDRLSRSNGALKDLKVDPELFASDAFWQRVSAKCISCGACTYLCPTCSCFNMTDEQGVLQGERIRSWTPACSPTSHGRRAATTRGRRSGRG
jgi:ferredoxin